MHTGYSQWNVCKILKIIGNDFESAIGKFLEPVKKILTSAAEDFVNDALTALDDLFDFSANAEFKLKISNGASSSETTSASLLEETGGTLPPGSYTGTCHGCYMSVCCC